MLNRLAALAAAVATLALTGCATRFENVPLPAGQTNAERRTLDLSNTDRPLILLAISGGGSRAAALGWVVLRELAQYRYASTDGGSRALIDDIGVVSSVSGGSVIAAHFALNGAQGLDRFEPDFLAPDNTRTLGMEALNPITWLSLAVTGASRSDLVEQLLDRQLFGHKTFAELNRPGKPYLILNATDMASGEVFAFTPQRFDDICSDLDAQAISTGVAASAAVPIVFTPIALRNHSAESCAGRPLPRWVANRLKGRFAPYLNLDAFKLARYANDLRHGPDSFRQIDYLYLLDGGLADNLAVQGLLEAVSSPYAAAIVAPTGTTLLDAINTGRVRKVALIVVNARADPAGKIYQSADRPGLLGMIGSVTSVPIAAAASSANAQMEELMAQFNAAGAGAGTTPGAPQFAGIKVYRIEIDFDQLRASDPAQRALRDQVKEVPTLWTISKANLGAIEQAGTTLLRQHPCFQRLLSELAIPAAFVDKDFAMAGCRQAVDP
ncbi:MAG: patatin-like phospholipase family protein [Burkholderiales bacterium]|nr:patatin-like phospholipase family protein [Burkholderiales bacterium]